MQPARGTAPRIARLPEELGFSVSSGASSKGWQIGQMEDGVCRSDDGEPDVLISHSYTDNCRRVDMAVFECDCPNHMTCCSHAYAALVKFPEYRHRAALLWALRMQFEEQDVADPTVEDVRSGVKAMLMPRLPLDELADASLDAAIGLWTRVDMLKKNRAPKMTSYWSQHVERALKQLDVKQGPAGAAATDAASAAREAGEAAQKRLADFLGKLQMQDSDLGPLLLALGKGSQGLPAKAKAKGKAKADTWPQLATRLWGFIAGDGAAKSSTNTGTSTSTPVEDVREAVLVAMADAPTEVEGWDALPPLHRLARIESLVLSCLGAESFPDLRVPAPDAKPKPTPAKSQRRPGQEKPTEQCYKSFLQFLADWPAVPDELLGSAEASGKGTAAPIAIVDGEAFGLLEELGRDSFQADGDEEMLAAVVNMHFGRRGDAADWVAVAKRALEAPRVGEENKWCQASILSAACSCWSPALGSDAGPARLDFLAAEGWESAATRLIGGAPPLAELGSWLLWDTIFEPRLGSLRKFLRQVGTGLGVACFELHGGEIVKLDAAAGTVEALEAALAGHDAARAVEALLAFCHACGSVRMAPLGETFGAAFKAAARDEGISTLVGDMLNCLPGQFVTNKSFVRFLLQPLSQDEAAASVIASIVGGVRAQQACMVCPGDWALTRSLSQQLVGRLSAEKGASGSAPPTLARKPIKPPPPAAQVGSGGASGESDPARESAIAVTPGQPTAPSVAQPAAMDCSAPPQAGPARRPADPAEALIEEIRRQEFGFEGEHEPAGELQRKQNARLARALKRLAGELYGSDVHWQLELLQNADDNTYEEELEPTAEFRLRDGEVVFRCNEMGFREGDIRAICDIGNSSKVGKAKYAEGGRVVATGEKGLGFKAVFALTNQPCIYSGTYRLAFDAMHRSGIGYVLPAWLSGGEAELGELLDGGWGSALKMPLRPDLLPRQEELFRRLAELPPSSLLFLKKLRDVAILDESCGSGGSIRMRRADVLLGMDSRWQEQTARAVVEVSRGAGPWERESWLLLRRNVQVPEGVSKPGIADPPSTTLVELAIPLSPDGAFDGARGAQPVFAFLPVRSFGLTFALQADWAVSSSREELLTGCAWNEFLKAQLPKLLIEVVEEVKKEPTDSPLRWSFYAAIPPLATTQPFFRSAIAQLNGSLRGHECMLTDTGAFCVPRLAFRCSAEVRSAMKPWSGGASLLEGHAEDTGGAPSPLRHALQAHGLHLISEMVEAAVPAGLLESLGVQRFGAAQLMKLLPMAAESRPCLPWWRRVLALLDELLDSSARADLPRFLEVARSLPLLPLEGGVWCSASAGVFLPPALDEAKGFPRSLLAELRAVDPGLLADAGGEDSLVAARVRKLMRRLEVPPLTPRQVLQDVVAPMFKAFAAPGAIAASAAPRPIEVLLTFAGFLATHADLADELRSAPIGWPTAGLDEVAVGCRFSAPALHSPRAAGFLEALEGSPLRARLPAAPPSFTSADVLGDVLERIGLAVPGPLVAAAEAGDWRCQEFEALLAFIMKEGPEAGTARAESLAEALNAGWSSYERYAWRDDGSPSTFLRALREKCWLPVDDGPATTDEGALALFSPSELCVNTSALRAVFTEASLLAGRLTSAVSGRFAEVLGVIQQPSVQLALGILRSFRGGSPVGPQAVAALYGYLEKEGADLGPLRASASVVVSAGKPLESPCDVVWEDETGACGLPALLPLYSTRWRTFFVAGLGVPERPTSHQLLRRIDVLTTSPDADLDSVWALLLFIAEQLAGSGRSTVVEPAAAGDGAMAEWQSTAEALKARRCLPLLGGGLGVPAEGIFYMDDCPRLPQGFFEEVQSSVLLAASPASNSAAWPGFLRALGLRPVSEACDVAARYTGEFSRSASLDTGVCALLPLAQRYMLHKHRQVHDAVAPSVAARLLRLRIRQVARPLQLQCSLASGDGCSALTSVLEVDAFLEDSGKPGYEEGPHLLAAVDAQMPAICVELARLVVPAAEGNDERAIAAAQNAREALTSFLASAAAGGGEALLKAFNVGKAPEGASRWPTPAEIAAEEAAARAAGAATDAQKRSADDLAGQEPTTKRAKTDAPEPQQPAGEDGDAVRIFDDGLGGGMSNGVNTMGGGGAPGDGKGKGKDGQGKGALDEHGSGGEGAEVVDVEDDADPAAKGKGKKGEGKKGEGKKGDGKKGDGKGGKGDGTKAPERSASDVGDIFKGFSRDDLPLRPATDLLDEKPAKVPRTRVYDLDDMRTMVKRMPLAGPVEVNNSLDKEAREHVGRWGEEFVYAFLKRKLEAEKEEGGPEQRVVWVNEIEETGFQYDLRIDNASSGEVEAYVEVKTTRAKEKHLFEMSYKEWLFAQKEGNKFVIFRVSNAGREDVEICSISNPFRQWKDLNLGMCLSL